MVFSHEDLIFQESIMIQAILPTLLVYLIQKIRDLTLGLMIQPLPEFWNISGVTNRVAFPFGRGVCNAVVLYGINTPNAVVCFTLTAHHLNDSLGVFDLKSPWLELLYLLPIWPDLDIDK